MGDRDGSEPFVAVLGAGPMLEVTVELDAQGGPDPEVHIHAGGQGLWVGRMAKALGARAIVCGPWGGEAGIAAAALARAEGLELRTTSAAAISTHLLDYRGGEREEIAVMPSRYEADSNLAWNGSPLQFTAYMGARVSLANGAWTYHN